MLLPMMVRRVAAAAAAAVAVALPARPVLLLRAVRPAARTLLTLTARAPVRAAGAAGARLPVLAALRAAPGLALPRLALPGGPVRHINSRVREKKKPKLKDYKLKTKKCAAARFKVLGNGTIKCDDLVASRAWALTDAHRRPQVLAARPQAQLAGQDAEAAPPAAPRQVCDGLVAAAAQEVHAVQLLIN